MTRPAEIESKAHFRRLETGLSVHLRFRGVVKTSDLEVAGASREEVSVDGWLCCAESFQIQRISSPRLCTRENLLLFTED